jgi:predicted lactoylglutathione lyase
MGFARDPRFCDENTSMVAVSDTIHIMLLNHKRFSDFTHKQIIDGKTQVQTLIALSATSRADVDATVEKAGRAGGRVDPNPQQDYSFMYGRSYEDPDGHIFEIAWMDMEAAMKASPQNQAA